LHPEELQSVLHFPDLGGVEFVLIWPLYRRHRRVGHDRRALDYIGAGGGAGLGLGNNGGVAVMIGGGPRDRFLPTKV
jgi:hypothetical protein